MGRSRRDVVHYSLRAIDGRKRTYFRSSSFKNILTSVDTRFVAWLSPIPVVEGGTAGGEGSK
jgi:hypothetical protein